MSRPAPVPANEARRLAALRECLVLDTAHEPVFDAITGLAATICDVPISLISLVDAERQWFKSSHGLDIDETPRDVAFCAHALHEAGVMQVPDAREDPRFATNPLVISAPGIRFYAGAPLRDDDGNALGTVCVIDRRPRELTPAQRESLAHLATVVMRLLDARRQALQAEEALRASERRIRTITDHLPALVAYIDAEERYQFNNATYELWLKRPVAEITGRTLAEVHEPALYALLEPPLRRALSDRRESFEFEYPRDGRSHFVRGVLVPELNAQGEVVGVYALTQDATRIKNAEDELRRLAHFDPLTGLANRTRLRERLEEALARSAREGSLLGVLYLDVDRFKLINDTKGHQVGDEVLCEYARRLQSRVRQSDTAARLGGDEFAVVLENLSIPDDAECVAASMVKVMEAPFELAGHVLPVTASVGVALAVEGDTVDGLLARADEALYRAKRAGRGCYRT